MKKIVGFKLFENGSFDYKDLRIGKDFKSHKDFAIKGIQNANEGRNFKNWLIYNAYLNLVLNEVPELDKESIIKSFDSLPFNFDKEIQKSSLGVKSVNWFIGIISSSLKLIDPVRSANDLSMKKMFISCIDTSLNSVINDLFWPGNLPHIQKLKYLDYFDENSINNYNIYELVKNKMDMAVSAYEKSEKNEDRIGEKFLSLLKIFSNHNMEFFKNMDLPDSMSKYIIKYFNSHPDSFKTADEIRKSNTGIYNRIKEILPNIDTSADLGDLGF